MFILFLPANLSSLSVMFLSALMGLSVDLLSGDLGLHMAACTAAGYARMPLLKKTSTNDVQIEIPTIQRLHFSNYFLYTIILILLHHIILFALETFAFSEILLILAKTLVSAAVNFILIGIIKMVITRK
jgi:hypothetical protein